jgi:hypothetical protein
MRRTRSIYVLALLGLCISGRLVAQDCTVTGRIFRGDGTPAANETVTVTKIEQNGTVVSSTATVYQSDANGYVTLAAPRNSEAWVQANNVPELNVLGGVPLSIPDAPTAALETLWQLPDGVLSFNGRAGDVTLQANDITGALGYSPVNPNGIIAAVNGSSEGTTISDGLLSANVPRLSNANAFQANISAPALYGGNLDNSALNLAGSSSQTTTNGNIFLNGDGQGNVLVGTRAAQSGSVLDSIARLTVSGTPTAGTTALRVNGAAGAASSLDIYTPFGQDKALRIITPDTGSFFQPKTYINNAGAYYTDAWMVISGHTSGSDAAGYKIDHPTKDPFMLGIWSDVTGPALQVRGGGYLFSGVSNDGLYTFSIEDDGGFKWGRSTRAGMDTNLYRPLPNTLRTDGTLQIGGDLLVGNRRNRSLTRALPTSANGTVDIGSFSFVSGSQVLSVGVSAWGNGISVSKSYRLPVQWNQAPANTWLVAAPASSTGAYLGSDFDMDVKVSGGVVSLRLRTSASNNATGTAYITVQEDGSTASTTFTPSTATGSAAAPTQVFAGNLVGQNGSSVGIGTNSPAADAILDVNGGDSKGLRIRPRSAVGAPTAGTWSAGTMIIDSAGTQYICSTGGTPGTWRRAVTDSGSSSGSAGVLSFNNRTGTVTLTGADVVNALGYTPAQLNSFQTGVIAVQSSSASTVPSVIRGATGQSADVQQWQNSSGQTVAAITASGELRMPSSASGKAPFVIDYRAVPNGTGDFNPTVAMGYNQLPDGSKVQPGENSLSWFVEGDYNDGTPNHKMEAYVQYYNADGSVNVRPLLFQIDRTTNQITQSVIRGPVAIESATGQPAAQFSPGNAIISASTGDTSLWLRSSATTGTHLYLGYKGNPSYMSLDPLPGRGTISVNGRNILNMYYSPAGGSGAAISVGADDSSAVGVFDVGANLPSLKGIAVRGKSGQTGNLQEWQNAGGAVLTAVSPTGALAVGSAAPTNDAKVDVNGGDTQGLRVRPRSTSGAPTSGAWSAGTMIVDSTGSLYICTAAGTPGSWQKVGAQ